MEELREQIITFFKEESERPLTVDEIMDRIELDSNDSQLFASVIKTLNALEQDGELILTRKTAILFLKESD